jgi:hypothetical protein
MNHEYATILYPIIHVHQTLKVTHSKFIVSRRMELTWLLEALDLWWVAAIHLLLCSNFIVMHNLIDKCFVDVIFAISLMVLSDH